MAEARVGHDLEGLVAVGGKWEGPGRIRRRWTTEPEPSAGSKMATRTGVPNGRTGDGLRGKQRRALRLAQRRMPGCSRHPIDEVEDGESLAFVEFGRQRHGAPGHGGRPYR